MRITVEFRRPVMRRPVAIGIALILLAAPAIVLASHQFGDVPDSNPFHTDIDAIADAGVTGGCGGGNYCPKSNVTREQMAAFMNRLGALGPGKNPVVNADRLDGRDSFDVVTHWLNVTDTGTIRSHSPGLEGVQVLRLPTSSTGTYCIVFPSALRSKLSAEAAVGSPQDIYGGFQTYGMAVTTTRGHACNAAGFWDIAVDITVNGAAGDSDFNVLIPAGGVVFP